MKLSLDALQEKAEAVASSELLNTITGGLMDGCHVTYSCDNCTVTVSGGKITIQP